MDHVEYSSKKLVIAFLCVVVLSVIATFWRTFISREYVIMFQSNCDPTTDRCFVQECTPDAPDTNPCFDAAATKEYFVQLAMDAHAVPTCTEDNHQCTTIRCTPDMGDECHETFCDSADSALPDGVTCNDPATYQPPVDDVSGTDMTSNEPASADTIPSTDTSSIPVTP